jgi:hypothetical protein
MPNNMSNEQLRLKRQQEQRSADSARRIATTMSRGNVSLQLGNFETAEQLEASRKIFESYEF